MRHWRRKGHGHPEARIGPRREVRTRRHVGSEVDAGDWLVTRGIVGHARVAFGMEMTRRSEVVRFEGEWQVDLEVPFEEDHAESLENLVLFGQAPQLLLHRIWGQRSVRFMEIKRNKFNEMAYCAQTCSVSRFPGTGPTHATRIRPSWPRGAPSAEAPSSAWKNPFWPPAPANADSPPAPPSKSNSGAD